MNRTLPFLFLLLLISNPLMAGSADAVIRGKTESGRTAFELRVGDIEGPISFVKLTIDGETYTIPNVESSSQTVVRDPENQVYFLVLNAGGKEFKLWMIPNTEKVTKKGPGSYHSRFAAVLEATDPRKQNEGKMTERITLGCTLDYEI
ncbi:hypothetical protein [Prosthecobacter sp.]|uniref:hypothetical protein n=1 Tax=Prosthecobacter sp. TaxID=1965333 RepID=UPI003783A466